jgi:leucyl/phenylalanyl-tRNA---protein transferase
MATPLAGELPVGLLLDAYRRGWFPMGERGTDAIQWFSPDPRGILPLDAVHIPARLVRTLRQGRFEVRIDAAFDDVIRACASRDETWISDLIVSAYTRLHREGHAHSVEVWQREELVGGLYGVALRGAFFGESMFHTTTDASKIALATLVDRLRAREFRLLDLQWVTPHLAQFGAISIRRRTYLRLLEEAMAVERSFA